MLAQRNCTAEDVTMQLMGESTFDQPVHGLVLVNSYFMQSVRMCLEGPSMYAFQPTRYYMMPLKKRAVLSNSKGTWVEFQEAIIQWKKPEHLFIQLKTEFSMHH